MKPFRFAFVVLIAGVFSAACAAGHEYWIAPSAYSPAVGQAVSLGTLAGTGFRGERKPWTSVRCVRLVARAAKTLDLSKLGQSGEVVWASYAPSDAGGAMIAYESNFALIELAGADFDRYLQLEGIDAVLAARRKAHDTSDGRERYRRCPKAWLAGSDVSRATKPIGMPLEIVPLGIPGAASSLPVRLLWQGRPLANALVKAWRAPFAAGGGLTNPETRDSVGVAWQARTNARGEASVPVNADGEWLVAGVFMEKSHDHEAADWESTWASLTFERRTSPKAKP